MPPLSEVAELGPDLIRELLAVTRGKLSVRQTELASGANLSQGTVSNFFNGRPIGVNQGRGILDALEAVVMKRRGDLEEQEFESIQSTLARARGYLERNRQVGDRAVNQTANGVRHLVENIMALTDEDRFNLTKSFDYFDADHFDDHVRCVRNGVQYRWLAYETDSLLLDWRRYRERLREQLSVQLHNDTPGNDVARELKALLKGVQCRVFPTATKVAPIPFRITIFDQTVCICTEERASHTYSQAVSSIVVNGQGSESERKAFAKLRGAWLALFKDCPGIEAWLDSHSGVSATKLTKLKELHLRLRKTLLPIVIDHYKAS